MAQMVRATPKTPSEVIQTFQEGINMATITTAPAILLAASPIATPTGTEDLPRQELIADLAAQP